MFFLRSTAAAIMIGLCAGATPAIAQDRSNTDRCDRICVSTNSAICYRRCFDGNSPNVQIKARVVHPVSKPLTALSRDGADWRTAVFNNSNGGPSRGGSSGGGSGGGKGGAR